MAAIIYDEAVWFCQGNDCWSKKPISTPPIKQRPSQPPKSGEGRPGGGVGSVGGSDVAGD
jgi:hypothetical protein